MLLQTQFFVFIPSFILPQFKGYLQGRTICNKTLVTGNYLPSGALVEG